MTAAVRPDVEQEAAVDQEADAGGLDEAGDAFDRWLDQLDDEERADLDAALEQGREDIRAGRVFTTEEVFAGMDEARRVALVSPRR